MILQPNDKKKLHASSPVITRQKEEKSHQPIKHACIAGKKKTRKLVTCIRPKIVDENGQHEYRKKNPKFEIGHYKANDG